MPSKPNLETTVRDLVAAINIVKATTKAIERHGESRRAARAAETEKRDELVALMKDATEPVGVEVVGHFVTIGTPRGTRGGKTVCDIGIYPRGDGEDEAPPETPESAKS